MLGKVDWRITRKGGSMRRELEEEGEIRREEIKRVIGKLKERKTAERGGIVNEVWKYGGEEVRKWLWEICNGVWRGESWPDEWREGIVVPIVKKREGKKVGDYRVTLTQTAYKVYAAVLAERLREEVEVKGILPPSQTGFRKGMGTIDQIYVLINKGIPRGKGKMLVMFVDMKAAFDSVDRESLIEGYEEEGGERGFEGGEV